MSAKTAFIQSIKSKDSAWLRAEIAKRTATLRTLKFDLNFGKVNALKVLRVAKRERAQLLTQFTQSVRTRKK